MKASEPTESAVCGFFFSPGKALIVLNGRGAFSSRRWLHPAVNPFPHLPRHCIFEYSTLDLVSR